MTNYSLGYFWTKHVMIKISFKLIHMEYDFEPIN